MERVAVLTDSISCLPIQMAEQYSITIVPAGNILYEGRTFRDYLDMDHDTAYRILETSPDHFFTAPTTPAEFLEIFRRLSKDYTGIIYVSLSAKLSTLQNSARIARDLAKDELPATRIEIFDSATATAAEGFIALEAAKAAKEGKSFDEIIKRAEEIRDKVDLFYVLDTIKYVYRTGRVPKPVAEFGSKLNVKPIVTVKKGSAQIIGLVRNTNRGVESLLRLAREHVDAQPVHMAVLHAAAPEEAEILKEKFLKEFDCRELWVSQFSPLMVYASGKYVLGIAFYTEDTNA